METHKTNNLKSLSILMMKQVHHMLVYWMMGYAIERGSGVSGSHAHHWNSNGSSHVYLHEASKDRLGKEQ